MVDSIALVSDSNGKFNFEYKDGILVREKSENSFAKHNIYCFGRLDPNLTVDPLLRKGFSGSVFESRQMYSIAWAYYQEGDITLSAMEGIIREFNLSCDADFKLGLFEKKIVMKSITKTNKNSILIKIEIGGEDLNFTINI